MDYKKANVEIIKSIIDRDDVRAQALEGGLTLVIPPPHYYGYILTSEEIAFALDRIPKVPKENRICRLEVIAPENEIKMTDDFRLIPYKRDMARRFDKNGKTVWINSKFLKNIDLVSCRFYQDKHKDRDVIIATEHGTPAMVILPLLMDE